MTIWKDGQRVVLDQLSEGLLSVTLGKELSYGVVAVPQVFLERKILEENAGEKGEEEERQAPGKFLHPLILQWLKS